MSLAKVLTLQCRVQEPNPFCASPPPSMTQLLAAASWKTFASPCIPERLTLATTRCSVIYCSYLGLANWEQIIIRVMLHFFHLFLHVFHGTDKQLASLMTVSTQPVI